MYSIVVPVYNSEKTLRDLHERVAKVFDEDLHLPFELVLVDDGSQDKSWEIMEELHEADPRVKIIQHMRNFGQHRALMCGLAHVSGEHVITMDDDLQHPPEQISVLVDAMQNNASVDVVIGAYKIKQHSAFRNLGTYVINRITSYVFNKDSNLKLTSFRIMRRVVAEEILKSKHHNPRVGQILLTVTNRIINVPVAHHAREIGRSGYTLRRLIKDALDNILSNSSLPLQVISYLGFICSSLSILLAVFYLWMYFAAGVSVHGFTTLVVLLLFLSGIMLFSFGVVGEYLIRILREVQGSTQTAVRRKKL